MTDSLSPEAQALRDQAIAPVLEALEIAQRLDDVAMEHSRSIHPSAYDDGLRTIDELSPGEWLKVGDTWCRYEFLCGDLLTVTVEHACSFSTLHIAEGERWPWHPAGF